jgi:hypothetical protein
MCWCHPLLLISSPLSFCHCPAALATLSPQQPAPLVVYGEALSPWTESALLPTLPWAMPWAPPCFQDWGRRGTIGRRWEKMNFGATVYFFIFIDPHWSLCGFYLHPHTESGTSAAAATLLKHDKRENVTARWEKMSIPFFTLFCWFKIFN